MSRIERWKRRRLIKSSVKTVSAIQNPSRSWQFLAHAHSPWAIIAQYMYDVFILVLLLVMFTYIGNFTDFINGRGDYRDRVSNEQRLGTCFLISSLEADTKGQLEALARSLKCPKGPLERRDGSADEPSTDDPPVPMPPDEEDNSGSDAGAPTP